jgi:hypothetical protein
MSIQIFVPDIKNNRVVLNPDNSIAFQQWDAPITKEMKKGPSTRYNTNKAIDQMDMVEVQDAYEKLYAKHKEVIDVGQSINDASDKQRMYSIIERIDTILKDGTKTPFVVPPKTLEERVNYLTKGQAWQEYHRLMTKYDLLHKTLPLDSEEQKRYVLICRKVGLNVANNAGTKLSASVNAQKATSAKQ